MVNIETLRNNFFNLIAQVVQKEQEHEDEVVELILKEIAEFIEAEFISAYIQFDEYTFYRLFCSYQKNGDIEPAAYFHQDDKQDIENYFKEEWNSSSVQTLQINLSKNDYLLLVIIKDEPVTSNLLANLEQECEKVFTIIRQIGLNKSKNESNEFLLDVSTKLMKSNDRKIVLTEIVNSFEEIYPEFPYNIILSQEYDEIDDLPIKFMDYTDENAESTVTEVFMAGEMRVIKNKMENKKIYAPLLGEQSVYGILEIIVPEKEVIRKDQIAFIYEFGLLAGKALEKTILYENSLLQVNNLTLLQEVIHQLNSSREITEITGIVRRKIMSTSKAEEVGFIYHGKSTEFDFEVLNGSTEFFCTGKGIKIARRLKRIIDEAQDAVFSGDFTSVSIGEYHSLMVFPMILSGMNSGFIVVLSKEKYYFTFENFKLIKTLIEHSSLAMANTILQQQLELTAITDHLTKLYSRKYLEEQIEENIKNGTGGVLLLFDIDDFKKVNDQHGHNVGDTVLIQIARVLMNKTDKKGIAARWGGEELAVYLPETNLEQGVNLAETIRLAVSENTKPNATISCGVSAWEFNDYISVLTLFLEADDALYEAKASGKNRVIISKQKTSL